MITATAILALLMSIASLAFGIYQYRILHRVRASEKATSLLRLAYKLRGKSQDLEDAIDSTDDAGDHTEFLAKLNALVEAAITRAMASKGMSLETLVEVERRLLSLELEIDLMHKDVLDVGRFNAAVREYEASRPKR